MRLSTIYLGLVVLALLVGLGVSGSAAQAPGQVGPDAEARAAAQSETLEQLRRSGGPSLADRPIEQARGLVRPSRQVTLRSPLNEQLKSISVVESQRVRAGDILARLDSREQVLAVEAARLEAESEAHLRKARLRVEEASFSLDHLKALAARDVAGSWEIRRAELELRQAEADVDLATERMEQARLQYERHKARLERYMIEAPFDGTIHRIEAAKGSLLSGDQPILSIVALDPLHAVVYVPLDQFGQLQTGRAYLLQAAAPIHETLTAELITIDPVLDPASQQFRCVFEIANPDAALPAGFTVRLIGPADDS